MKEQYRNIFEEVGIELAQVEERQNNGCDQKN